MTVDTSITTNVQAYDVRATYVPPTLETVPTEEFVGREQEQEERIWDLRIVCFLDSFSYNFL